MSLALALALVLCVDVDVVFVLLWDVVEDCSLDGFIIRLSWVVRCTCLPRHLWAQHTCAHGWNGVSSQDGSRADTHTHTHTHTHHIHVAAHLIKSTPHAHTAQQQHHSYHHNMTTSTHTVGGIPFVGRFRGGGSLRLCGRQRRQLGQRGSFNLARTNITCARVCVCVCVCVCMYV
jgi:hypothetical protein